MSDTSVLLGLECGGTHTVALAADGRLKLIARVEAGPANLRLLTNARLVTHFRALRKRLPRPTAIGVGMAGARAATDFTRLEFALEQVWPGVPRQVNHDLASALATADLDSKGKPPAARVIVLSGTGSCCYGRNSAGKIARVGGWGHQLGDRGSAYDLALTALRGLAKQLDHTAKMGRFGERLLGHLQLNEPNDLIEWLQSASKTEVAALAPLVFQAPACATTDHARAAAANSLASDASACARQLVRAGTAVEFIFAGSVLLRQAQFSRTVAARIHEAWPLAACHPLRHESVWGAVVMAQAASGRELKSRPRVAATVPVQARPKLYTLPATTELSPTERRNQRSLKLDQLPLPEALELMWSEEAKIPAALRTQRRQIATLIRAVVRAFKAGGRLFYVGAGTSGRLGVLDASECPPTFRTSPELVQGIIAGGVRSLHSAVEGAEDDGEAGGRAVGFRGVGPRDIVVGIAASGRTPFVWGALAEARRHGARTALVCFNPYLVFAPGQKPDIVIAPDLGPEVLTGSTRLKAGTATKLILNSLTTLALVQLGKVAGNLMVDLNPSNLKLRERAARIVGELARVDHARASAALERHHWQVPETLRALRQSAAGRKSRFPTGKDAA